DSLALAQQQKRDTIQKDSISPNLVAKDFSTENQKFKIKFSGRGGYISELLMKEYSAFDSAATNHKRALYLIKDGNNQFNLKFKDKSGKEINTADLSFSPIVQKADSVTVVTMTAPLQQGNLQFVYTIGTNYTIGFEVKSEGIHQITSEKKLALEWNLDGYSIEKGRQQETYWAQTYFRFKGTNDVEYELFGADE